jgi:alkylation response protein AidB-like acyl-CoA dehydrogenase
MTESRTSAGLDRESLGLLLDTLRSLGKDLLTPEKCLEWDEKDILPEEVIRTMLSPDVGLHLVFLPEDCGGMGGGARDIYRVSEEMARLDLGVATAFLAIALGSDPLRVGATDEQRRRWLGSVAERGLIVAYGVTEPEAGSNVAALKTVARPVISGGVTTGYVLSGTKQFISNGAVADLYTILAAAPGGPSFFVVERGARGLEVGHVEVKHGIRSSNTSQVILDEVQVPADQLIGLVEGKGLDQANEVFGFTRVMVAAFGLGGGEAALARAIAYSKERKQFGKLLCQLKGYTHKLLVPHVVRLEAARSYIEQVCARLDGGEPGLQTEGSIAKLFATEAGNAAAEAAIQAHGGYGYTREYLVEKIKRDVRITTIYEGTSEIQQSIIYLYRFRQVVRSKGAFYREPARALRELGGEVAAPLVADCAEALATALGAFHQHRVSREQNVMFELADRIADVEHAMAFCRRAARSGAAPIQAGCRLFAAEAATRLVASASRIASASTLPDAAVADLRRELGIERLASCRAGSFADMDTVLEWLLASDWPVAADAG